MLQKNGFWASCPFADVNSQDIAIVRKKVKEWLRQDSGIALVVGENSVILWKSYQHYLLDRRPGGSFPVLVRVWEDCLSGKNIVHKV